MRSLTIGRVARLAGVGVETVRFYERRGLIPEPPRRASGYRDYPEEAVERIAFIRRARDLGFSLAEVRDLLSLRVEAGDGGDEVRARAQAKLADVEVKISHLRGLHRALERLTASGDSNEPTRDCPILDSLDPPEI